MAVLIEPGLLSPIPPDSEHGICISCLKKTATWVFRKHESWCAYCFLYVTEWARSSMADIINFATVVGDTISKQILEDDSSRVSEAESNRILSAIIFVSLVKYSQDNNKAKSR